MKALRFIKGQVTTGEHNDLMHNAYYAVEVISDSLRRANALAALKEIYAVGKITDDVYTNELLTIMRSEGFEINNI